MNISSATSSYASQALSIRPSHESSEINRSNNANQQPVASPSLASQAGPTVNTSGQTIGQLINITA